MGRYISINLKQMKTNEKDQGEKEDENSQFFICAIYKQKLSI